MDWYVKTLLGLKFIESCGNFINRLVASVKGAAEDRDYADRVLVALFNGLVGGQVHPALFNRNHAWLNIPIAAELLPANLDICSHHEVRPFS